MHSLQYLQEHTPQHVRHVCKLFLEAVVGGLPFLLIVLSTVFSCIGTNLHASDFLEVHWKKTAPKNLNFQGVFEEFWHAYNHPTDFIIELLLLVLYTENYSSNIFKVLPTVCGAVSFL